MPTWMDFGLKNPPKSALGRLLGRLVAVLGRLGPSWRALETSWRGIEKWYKKRVHKKSAKSASSGVLGAVFRSPDPLDSIIPGKPFSMLWPTLVLEAAGPGFWQIFWGVEVDFGGFFWRAGTDFWAFWYTFLITFSHHVLCMMVSRVHGRIMYFTYFGLLQTFFLTLDAVDAFKHWSLDTALGLQDF